MSTTRRRVKVRCVACGTRYKVDTSSESSVRRDCPCGGQLVPDDGSAQAGGAEEFLVLEDRPAAAGTLPGDVPAPARAGDNAGDTGAAARVAARAPRDGAWLKWVILVLVAAATGWWIWRIAAAS